MLTSDGASVSSSGTGGFCFGCSVSNTSNVVNANTSDNASISIPIGLGGYGYIRLALPQTYPSGTRVGWVADVNGGIAGLFNGVTLRAYNDGSLVATVSGGSLFNVLGIGGGININGVFCSDFDEIEIQMGSLTGLLASYQVYYAYVTDDCSFPVQCGSATGTEYCNDKIDNDGDGLVDSEDACVILDADGDGIDDHNGDTDPGDACIPAQGIGYMNYDGSNATWQAEDCDNDGVDNGQEVTDMTDPYDASSNLLPVQLARFEGKQTACNVELDWVVETEENFHHYEIEWSRDGKSFRNIFEIKGNSFSTSTQYYNYSHQTNSASNYYRLKMIDLDDSFEYSDVLFVALNCNKLSWSIFPNPISTNKKLLNIEINTPRKEVQILVSDLLGRIVSSQSFSVEPNVPTIVKLVIPELPVGSYFVKLTGEKSSTKLFTIRQ